MATSGREGVQRIFLLREKYKSRDLKVENKAVVKSCGFLTERDQWLQRPRAKNRERSMPGVWWEGLERWCETSLRGGGARSREDL